MSDTTGRELLAKYGPTFGDVIGNLERELSAANARIAELEDAVRRNGIKVSAPLGSLLSPHDITEPSQPTTLPESKQQK